MKTIFALSLLLALPALADAQRGAVVYGALDVPAGVDAATSIPTIVVNGASDGPVVAFVAGSHGTEYTSIVALTQLASHIDPARLKGTVIVAPLLNVASFEQMTVHVNPIDKKGMNASYPGDPGGTQTQRALAMVASQIVARAGVIVDLHGGDLDEDLVPYSYWMRGGKAEQDAASLELTRAFGLERIIVNDVDLKTQTRSLSGYALSLGKTVVVAEAGANGRVDSDDVRALVDGCLNVLGALHMLERRVVPVEHPLWLGSGARVRAETPGIFTPAVRGGTYVAAGALLGTMSDYTGRRLAEIRAPIAGLVTFIRGVPSAWKDATLANVSPVLAEPPVPRPLSPVP